MIYLFLGLDNAAKTNKIAEIKQRWLPTDDARKLDYEILYAPDLGPKTLKEALSAFPAVAAKRVLHIRDVQHLTADNQHLIIDFVQSSPEHLVLLLEAERLTAKDAFHKKLASLAEVFDSSVSTRLDIFEMTKAMGKKQNAAAFQKLRDFLDAGQHPLQMMGALLWFWGSVRPRVSREGFEQGLKYLEEADLDIKRSRLPADFAMERLLARWSVLLNQGS